MDTKRKLLEVELELAKSELEMTQLQASLVRYAYKSVAGPSDQEKIDAFARIIREQGIDPNVHDFPLDDSQFQSWPTFNPPPIRVFTVNYRSVDFYVLFFSDPAFVVLRTDSGKLKPTVGKTKRDLDIKKINSLNIAKNVANNLKAFLDQAFDKRPNTDKESNTTDTSAQTAAPVQPVPKSPSKAPSKLLQYLTKKK